MAKNGQPHKTHMKITSASNGFPMRRCNTADSARATPIQISKPSFI
jgi:hypothetical protein